MRRKLMNRKLLFVSVGLILVLTVLPAAMAQDWANHKMHFPQLPDEDGWDVHVDIPMFLADDWTCSETGPITDIHWWGSWLDESEGIINEFIINIWADVPADELDPASYSHPGAHLHSINAPTGSFTITPVMPDDLTMYEGWYDPSTGYLLDPDHQEYFRYDLILNEQDWFDQEVGTVYWLSIECLVEDVGGGHQWGWKNSQDHHLDDAVYSDGQGGWVEIYEPAEELSNWFEIQIDPSGWWVGGYGVGAYVDPADPSTNGWYLYEGTGTPWWNIWFYDHPLDYERIKDIRIEYTVQPLEPANPEMYAEVTPNWATDIYTESNPTNGRPPMPGDFGGTEPFEEDWIGRGDPPDIWQGQGDGFYTMRIWDYNPEWVSVDVNGFNVWVEGTIYHTCMRSLDLAFVITSDYAPPPEGACCYPDAAGIDLLCIVTTQADCEQTLGGVYQGDGTTCMGMEACCLPDGSCVMADALCCVNELGGSPQGAGTTCTALEACCMVDNTCQMLDPLCCVDLGGSPQGQGTTCTAVEACCFDDGSCQDLDPLCCVDLGGTPEGAGTNCATTTCEIVPDSPKNWNQPPDLSTLGMDVNATFPMFVLADDFLCTETGGIQEIHIWGSWFEDIYPGADLPLITGDPGNVSFHISIHADIPAGALAEWSMPGEMIADWVFEPYDFIYKKVNLEGPYEGWFNPPDMWIEIGDRNCWEYIFQFNDQTWFEQQGSDGAPIVYWLDVQAIIPIGVTPAIFGWKTSIEHWNDDAVWFAGVDEPGQLPWEELRYMPPHPFAPESIDQAFMIGGPCDCEPGESDGLTSTPDINILDIVYLINFKYKGASAPVPYALCSGDANCTCTIDILDIIYIINYIYKNGPHPCTCGNFIANCPGGLR